MRYFVTCVLAGVCVFCTGAARAADDPWKRLKDAFAEEEEKTASVAEPDPWAELRRVYLPFSQAEEEAALVDAGRARALSHKLMGPLRPYIGLIGECSRKFDVPPEIIGAIIMVESGGDPRAAAATSSARGLMQTIRGTFSTARTALQEQGTVIADDPFNPRASIYAGTWYLSHVFDRAATDNGDAALVRGRISDWSLPAKYYYAGPSWGARKSDIIITYVDGRKIVVDKKTYCDKVMRYAGILHSGGALRGVL